MTRLDRLVREAKAGMESRGHSVSRASRFPSGRTAVLRCHACPCSAQINTAPPPNGIELGGDGLALQCRRTEYELIGTEYQRAAAYLASPGGLFRRLGS